MNSNIDLDDEALRAQVQDKYREVAATPDAKFHFHTGRKLAELIGYAEADYEHLSEQAIESFAGVANPFSLREIESGEQVLDVGAGAGFDCFVAAGMVGDTGQVIGVDMTEEMLTKAQQTASDMNAQNVEFREGLLESLPVEDEWADVVISNGAINLCSDKQRVLAEVHRVLKPGGHFQFADIANGEPVPDSALNNIDLWTA